MAATAGSVVLRFSLDETFDVGEDTGTAIVDDYADKMPFAYQGKLNRFLVVLQPEKLSPEDKQRLLAQLAQMSMAVH